MATRDYLIVGAGSAGCVLANRLSADPKSTVTLFEAGGRDRRPCLGGYFKTTNDPRYCWGYETEPDAGLNGRRIVWPRGKVLGGSSSINGHAPRRIRSAGGFVPIMQARNLRCVGQGGGSPGYRFNEDHNGADQEGVGYFKQNDEKRSSLQRATSNRRNAVAISGSCRAPARFESLSRASVRYAWNPYPARRTKRNSGQERRSWLLAARSARRICSCFQASAVHQVL